MAVESVPSPDLSEYFRNSVDLLSVYQIGGKFGVLNPSWQRVLGWSPQDLEGHDFIDFVHPDDVKATIDENRAEWSDDSLTRAGFENRLRIRDGTYRWFEWTSQRTRRPDLRHRSRRDPAKGDVRRTGGERRDDQGHLRGGGGPDRHRQSRSGDRAQQPAGSGLLRLRGRRSPWAPASLR